MKPANDSYKLKKINFKDKQVSIVLQNTNGPCPLLAVANILLLRGDISIHEDKAVVGADELLGRIGEYLLDTKIEIQEQFLANHERNVSDVIQMLPSTQRGMDVNVQFKGISAFEFTSESMLFDFCNTRLVHGWLVDPQDKEMYDFIHNLSYNQLVEKQIQWQTLVVKSPDLSKKLSALSMSEDGDEKARVRDEKEEEANKIIREGLLAEKFLNESATQITYHGLSELHSGIKEEELCVFFRNNHFCTLYKHNKELLLLATDQGYANEPLVWEKLNQIDGDSVFLRSDYSRYEALSPSIRAAFSRSDGGFDEDRIAQSDRDMALALQLQQEEEAGNRDRQNNTIPPDVQPEHAGKGKKPHHAKKTKEGKEGGCVIQ